MIASLVRSIERGQDHGPAMAAAILQDRAPIGDADDELDSRIVRISSLSTRLAGSLQAQLRGTTALRLDEEVADLADAVLADKFASGKQHRRRRG